MTNFLLIAAVATLGVLGDVFLKLAGERTPAHLGWLGLGTLTYVLTVPGWLFVMRNVPLSGIGPLYAVSSVLLLVLIGVVGFKERLGGMEVLGLVFALLAIVAFRRLL